MIESFTKGSKQVASSVSHIAFFAGCAVNAAFSFAICSSAIMAICNSLCDPLPEEVHCLTKIFPGGFSTDEVLPLHRFSTSAETPPGTKNAQRLVLTREKPKMARLGKKRQIPGEASGCWLPHWNVTNTTDTEGLVKSPLSYQA